MFVQNEPIAKSIDMTLFDCGSVFLESWKKKAGID